MRNLKEPEKPKMVGWYDPSQLLDTGLKTLISTIIGENADPRLVASLATSGKFFDYSKKLVRLDDNDFAETAEVRKEIWIDYVSDVGDGWNPTYAVAHSLAKPRLEAIYKEETVDENTLVKKEFLERGEILVFGGDGVYPMGTPEEYERRLITPYRMAFKAHEENNKTTNQNRAGDVDLTTEPHVFALPGNHDWYDSLVAFQKVFCTNVFNNRKFADAWQTRQEISYFALKLPQKWWLFGADLQLSHNIDLRQLEYFENVVGQMEKGDKIILCIPEPYWVKAIKYQGITDIYEKKEESIEKLENILKAKGVEIKVFIAGDLHHYRRFEDINGVNKITAGGGGAFLHPTHDFNYNKKQLKRKSDGKTVYFDLKKEYPSFEESKKQDWKNLYKFIWNNKTFGILTGLIYIFLALLINGKVEETVFKKDFWLAAFEETVKRAIDEPLAFIVVITMLLGLIFFTDSNSKSYRRIAGTIHGLLHLTAAFFLGWSAFYLSRTVFKLEINQSVYPELIWLGTVIVICGIGGYIIGSIIMGLYLFVSLHIFRRHDNEAFSALKIEDYKNFLRLHINTDGSLTIYPLKIDKVPRKWKPVSENKGNNENEEVRSYEPEKPIQPELIEKIAPIFSVFTQDKIKRNEF